MVSIQAQLLVPCCQQLLSTNLTDTSCFPTPEPSEIAVDYLRWCHPSFSVQGQTSNRGVLTLQTYQQLELVVLFHLYLREMTASAIVSDKPFVHDPAILNPV
jgi:hypothetical protein